MKTLADSVCLRGHRFSSGIVDIVYCEAELIIVLIDTATILSASVSEDSEHRQVIVLEKR